MEESSRQIIHNTEEVSDESHQEFDEEEEKNSNDFNEEWVRGFLANHNICSQE